MIGPRKHWWTGFRLSSGGTGRRAGRWITVGVALGLMTVIGVSCGGSSETESPSATTGPSATASPEAPSNTVWLCRPGLADNPCESDLTTTVVAADGSSTIEEATPAEDPPIDCFYVYPTVSGQPGPNASLEVEPEETAVAVHQAARFSEVCKVYAPIYRQLTLSTIGTEGVDTAATDLAYSDVLSAWRDYLAHYNDGRGLVLIGHSQGTMMLTRLIASEIEPDPDQLRLLVSALLIGGNVTVAKGEDAGGDFENVPACRSASQIGCVVAYSSFSEPPPPDAIFGRVGGPGSGLQPSGELEVLCVNPASLSGGTGLLEPYFSSTPLPGALGELVGTARVANVPTAWVAYPDLYTAYCDSAEGANWLQVDTTSTPGDQRPVVTQSLGPAWGLHLADISIALGNLVDLVRQQGATFLAPP
jgi:hypothetical protein